MRSLRGVVVDFDEARGDGSMTTDQGEHLYFHCLEIADGSRRVAVGARVVARRAAGHLGRDEARDVALEISD